jgi:hypothetical protein
MAASVGLEPTTITLTACSSTIELWGNAIPQVSVELTASCSSHKRSTNWAIGGKRRRRDLNPRRVLNRSFLAGKRHKPLGHFSLARTEGFEPPNLQLRKLSCCPLTTHSLDRNCILHTVANGSGWNRTSNALSYCFTDSYSYQYENRPRIGDLVGRRGI